MDNRYDAKKIEDNYYKICENRGYFELNGNKDIQKKGKYFSLMMPPPNVTGSLHIGHALTLTVQDVITRYKRMSGFKTLWQPGIDHAGIATQNIVEKQLLSEGTTKDEIGREEFLKRAYKQKQQSGDKIVYQMRKLGITPAWSRQRFTMDSGLCEAVKTTFVKLFDDGLITKNNYMINWCTKDGALSDIEVEHEEVSGNFYFIKYELTDGGFLTVATTRPETYFGDTALMVHPRDKRYQKLIGKTAKLPLINKPIKIIADDYVDKQFGTGIVKVTPAHDQNDYEVGIRHNLEFVKIFDEKGILNENCAQFAGLERLQAREKIVQTLEQKGHIEKIEPHTHQVGKCYRCKNIVEPYISKQWFLSQKVATNSIKKTKELSRTRAKNGGSLFHPSRWINSYTAWMDELRPWCISRQLWWGHRIPVFYCDNCAHTFASTQDNPTSCAKCSCKKLTQDKDVLDTWFSSALWAMSPLGWQNNGKLQELYHETDMKEFYPNSLLITGFDIMFFWVARMMMMGEYFTSKLPFDDIYMHALVRDEFGDKMSKSKGNVIDPLDMIELHSADVVRFTLCFLSVQGRDIKLGKKNLEQFRNFTNKLYNATNYLLLNYDSFENMADIKIKTAVGRYIQSRLNQTIIDIKKQIDSYKFNEAALSLYSFVWTEFCDWTIEYSKADKESIKEIGSIFKETLKLISPFMPFIADNLYHKLNNTTLEHSKSLMVQEFPDENNTTQDKAIEKSFDILKDIIISIRRAKVQIDMGNSLVPQVYVQIKDKNFDIKETKKYIEKLAKVKNVEQTNDKHKDCVVDVSGDIVVYVPTKDIDMSNIKIKLQNQKTKLSKEFDKLQTMLNNKKFISNAPQKVLDENQEKYNKLKQNIENINKQMENIR
ncbi:MAG: valine--tRNA ligase [Epsilonproteobacteria bacterium]|nr:MAG: valine--tRNA ligase [Campylobacterota bacterium]